MPFLSLNGITVPVDTDGGAIEWVDQADAGRGLDGSFQSTIYTSKRRFAIGLRRLSTREANAWARLAKGLGHRFAFVDLYSSKGLLGVATGTVTPNGASGKFGGVRITTAASPNSNVAWTFGVDRHHGLIADYTVSVWHEDSGPVWNHYLIVRRAGSTTWFLNGAPQGAGTPGAGSLIWFNVDLTLGKITLGQNGTAHAFAAMVWHPFAIGADSGEWVTSFSGATAEHPDLPTLRAAGDLVAVNGATTLDVECDPQSVKTKPAPFTTGGAWDKGAREVDFELEEL